MANNDVRGIVLGAAKAVLDSSITIEGDSQYVLASNSLAWDSDKFAQMTDIATNFGIRSNKRALNSDGVSICCGQYDVSVFDFGLLYSVFSAIVSASIDTGSTIVVESVKSQEEVYNAAWFCSDVVIYSKARNFILCLTNRDVYSACNGGVTVKGFTTNASFKMELEGNWFVVSNESGEFVCKFLVPVYVTQVYRSVFDGRVVVDDPNTSWDETSMLGALVADADDKNEVQEAYKKYLEQEDITTPMREDLICTPTKQVEDPDTTYGRWVYSHEKEVIMPIGESNGLLVYTTSQSIKASEDPDLKCYVAPDFSKFYDVNDEFIHIMRFALCVKNLPLTPAELDTSMYFRIREAFMEIKLKRLPLAKCLGRIIIPEEVMLRELGSDMGDIIYCIVVVGVMGDQVIELNSQGHPICKKNTDWKVDGYFYDVTDIVSRKE